MLNADARVKRQFSTRIRSLLQLRIVLMYRFYSTCRVLVNVGYPQQCFLQRIKTDCVEDSVLLVAQNFRKVLKDHLKVA